jgi:hypothetical protein
MRGGGLLVQSDRWDEIIILVQTVSDRIKRLILGNTGANFRSLLRGSGKDRTEYEVIPNT